jgi:HEPN domain-containing protein
MSAEKDGREALRWLRTAEGDLTTARVLLAAGRYAHACFHAHQAAEKAVKSGAYLLGGDPWGHSVQELIAALAELAPDGFPALARLAVQGARLDRFYIPTRYPNGLPQETPDDAFFDDDARWAIEAAGEIVAVLRTGLTGWPA